MVFVKFYNMKQEKKNFFRISPLNSNKLTNFHFTSQNNITITVQKCSVFFSSFFNLCTVYFTKKMFVLSFFSYMLCSTMFKFISFFLSLFPLSCSFLFLFLFSFFFHNKMLIQCPFLFQPYLYLSLSLP